MSRISNVHERFKSLMYTVKGRPFFGQILNIPDTSRVSNFLSSRRYLRVSPEQNINWGDVIIALGRKFIVADHGEGYSPQGIVYKHFKLFAVSDEVTFKRVISTKNSVTGIMSKTLVEDDSISYLSIQPKNSSEDSVTKIPNQNHIILCNVEVKKDDEFDDKIVIKVDKALGIYILEVKER